MNRRRFLTLATLRIARSAPRGWGAGALPSLLLASEARAASFAAVSGGMSLKELARDVLQENGNISVQKDILSAPGIPGGISLLRSLKMLRAIRGYAPKVWFHLDEEHFPSSVEWYLARVRMRFHLNNQPDVQVLDEGQVNINSLLEWMVGDQYSGSGSSKTDFFLEIMTSKTATRAGSLGNARCYVHFRAAPTGGSWDIQYWFFYPYSGNISHVGNFAHEGDWEHITVRLAADLTTVTSVFFAAHDEEGKWVTPSNVEQSGTHPVCFSAKNGHACYSTAGRQDRPTWPDDHTGKGTDWNTWTDLRLTGERSRPMSGRQWIKYTGRWGEIGMASFTTGPHGPAFQSSWNAD
jgi:hypothetical protein